MSVPAKYESEENIDDVVYLYSDMLNQYPKSFHEHQGRWKSGHKYYHPGHDSNPPKLVTEPHTPNYDDYHPNTMAHYEYFKYLGFNFNEQTYSNCENIVNTFNSYTHYSQFLDENPGSII
jgi:hypothetical protein